MNLLFDIEQSGNSEKLTKKIHYHQIRLNIKLPSSNEHFFVLQGYVSIEGYELILEACF